MSLAQNLEDHFRRRHKLPDNFYFFRWVCMPLDGETIYYEITGGIVNSFYKSGPRKGKPKLSEARDCEVFRMTVDEYDELFKTVGES